MIDFMSAVYYYIVHFVLHTYAELDSGTEYNASDIFDLTKMEPYNLDKLYKSFTRITKDLVLYLPRTSDLNQIARYAQAEGKKLEVAHYAMMGASKVRGVGMGR